MHNPSNRLLSGLLGLALGAFPASGQGVGPPLPRWTVPQASVPLGPGHSGALLSLADMNADGWPDIVISDTVRASGGGGGGKVHQFTVLLNRGDGTFGEGVATPVPSVASLDGAAFALGDLDEDGVADLVTSRRFLEGGGLFPNISVLFGTPSGRFSGQLDLRTSFDESANTNAIKNRAIVLADVNRDGHLDIITTTADGRISVLPGDGKGHFGWPIISGRTLTYDMMIVGDVNGDGLPDVVTISDSGSQTAADTGVDLCLGYGDGRFGYYSTTHVDVRFVASYDCDPRAYLRRLGADNVPSLVIFGNEGPTSGDGGLVILRFAGQGGAWRFTPTLTEGREEDNFRTQTIALADVDGDGDYDIIKVPRPGVGPGQILLNDGAGGFTARIPFLGTSLRLRATAAANLVGDALPDLMLIDIPDNDALSASAWCLGNTTPPPCPADFDHDGVVTQLDFALFQGQWLSTIQGNGTVGDFNHDGVTNPADITDFMNVWFAALASGC